MVQAIQNVLRKLHHDATQCCIVLYGEISHIHEDNWKVFGIKVNTMGY
jgi:hypothetical protein